MTAYKDITKDEMTIFARLILDGEETTIQKNCPFCHDPFLAVTKFKLDGKVIMASLRKDNSGWKIVPKDKNALSAKTEDVNYCPNCGRKLTK